MCGCVCVSIISQLDICCFEQACLATSNVVCVYKSRLRAEHAADSSCNMLTDKFLQLQAVYFRLLGYEIFASGDGDGDDDDDGDGGIWRHPCRTIYSIMSVASFLPLTVAFCVRYVQNVDKLTDGLCSVLIDLLALFKLALILWRHKDFVRLIARFRSILTKGKVAIAIGEGKLVVQIRRECASLQRVMGPVRVPRSSSNRISGSNSSVVSIEIAFHSRPHRRVCCRWCGGFSPVNRSRSCPFPACKLHKLFATNLPRLALHCSYPWDNRRVLNYLASYVWNVSAALGVLLPTVCVDTLFCSLTHNLCALLKIAQFRVQHFVAGDETLANLSHILKLYRQSLDMSGAITHYFRPLIGIQFLLASLHLCVLCYQLSANLTQPEVLFYAAFTCSILSQLYMYCYCCESVNTETSQFAAAIYDSHWFDCGSSWSAVGRPLLLSMMRAQRGFQIDGLFFVANMPTFLSVRKYSLNRTELVFGVYFMDCIFKY